MKKIKPVTIPKQKHRNFIALEHIRNTPKAGTHSDKKKEINKLKSRKYRSGNED